MLLHRNLSLFFKAACAAIVAIGWSPAGAQQSAPSRINWGEENGGKPYSFKRSKDGTLLRFEVRNNDQRPGDGTMRERSEIRMTRELPHGSRVHAKFDLRLDKLSEGHRFQIFSQWHTKAARGWGPWLGFRYLEPGKLTVNWLSSPAAAAAGYPIKPIARGNQVIPCALGEWCNMQVWVRTDPVEGSLIIEKGARRYVNYRGPIGYFRTSDSMAPMGYMKIGIYRWHNKRGTETVAQVRNLQVNIR